MGISIRPNEPQHFPKHHKIIDYKAKSPSLLNRHIRWLKSDHSKFEGLVTVLKVIEILLASILCLPLAVKAIKMSSKIEAEKKFNKAVAEVQRPDSNILIEMKTPTRTFTHTHEIIIEKGYLWSRHRHSGGEWKPMYFDGFKDKKNPITLSADGANLIVIDEDQRVHYKKLIREYRAEEITPKNKRAQQFIQGSNVELNKDAYIVVDKTEKNNWKEKWFTLPVVSLLVQMFKKSKKLNLPAEPRAMAISHRGRYNDYLEDGAGFHHHVTAGVTTLYVLEKNGKIIRKYDPWSPENAKMNIHVPETSTASFEAINMDAAASHIMLLGYESSKNPKGAGVVQRLTIKTKLADIDSEGWNPGLKYDYVPDEKNPKVRVIAPSVWRDHPLDLKRGEKITKNISILQRGEGNDAREIRIEGWNSEGKGGYFYKMVNEKEWKFQLFEGISNDKAMDIEIEDKETEFSPTVSDFDSKTVKFNALKKNEQPQVILKNFGIGSTDSPLKLRFGEKEYELNLHRKKTFINFLGIEGDHYDLVVPELLHNDKFIRKLFHSKKSINVHISAQENPPRLRLKSSRFNIILLKNVTQ